MLYAIKMDRRGRSSDDFPSSYNENEGASSSDEGEILDEIGEALKELAMQYELLSFAMTLVFFMALTVATLPPLR